jgi:hypothetical protein
MTEAELRKLLEQVQDGAATIESAVGRLRDLPFEDLAFAKVDHHRSIRCGFPEVIFCQGKTPDEVVQIFGKLVDRGGNVLATRVSPEQAAAIRGAYPGATLHDHARAVTLRQSEAARSTGTIAVVSAGTSDGAVAEEAAVTAEIMDQRVQRIYDVGVAGLHRLLASAEAVTSANVCVVVAGMEGALPSVVGGLVSKPVIAVPTSVGYGASFNGLAALLAMLNSCASGVGVVNIDNGFAAGYLAAQINRLAERSESAE